ncbi:glycoside hydrolase family 19 protein [Chryseobacterium sp. YIM B08800]|uniref:glycoside hydrolase family 19 protein n=1 Tax=Chryseobacterium sp. YIM B08800 TaxID=2984136 RepID=UPI00223F30BF|nr:hypothetical protein [Chryseobacterium sp. YIM B08800]
MGWLSSNNKRSFADKLMKDIRAREEKENQAQADNISSKEQSDQAMYESARSQNSQKMQQTREERKKEDDKQEGQLLAIDGAKIKFNSHMGTFRVLNDVPTTQDKLTGTIVEKQIPNFIFNNGFQMLSLTKWQDFGTVNMQDNFVLLKKSILPGTGKMPGNAPTESGKIEFVDSGQIHAPENLNTFGAPVPEKEKEKCFCEKEFTKEDIMSFYNSKKLFTAKNCPLPDEMKTYQAFTDALNKAMKDYDINTCLRKAHFLAQIEAETGLATTIEYADGWDYDHTTHIDAHNKYKLYLDNKKRKDNPYLNYNTIQLKRSYNRYKECISHQNNTKGDGPKYKGRGLLQLTWKDTYIYYFDYIKQPNYIDSPNIVAEDINYTCSASAWYWKFHSAWKDLNIAADRDDIYYINIGVNGGFNHFDVRIKNVKKILETMKVKEDCINIDKLEKELGKYKYSTSKIKDYSYGKKQKAKFEKYDDK